MRRRRAATVLTVAALIVVGVAPADARIHRSQTARHAFVREHPCPGTGKPRLPCHGYIIDHRHALCVGGEDRPENMRWMTVSSAKAKDRWECRPDWRERLAECEAKPGGCFVEH